LIQEDTVNIALSALFDINDVNQLSGTPYYMARALERQSLSVERIEAPRDSYRFIREAKQAFYKYFLHQTYRLDWSPLLLKAQAKQVSRRIAGLDIDAIVSCSVHQVAYLECHQPLVTWTDATIAGMFDFYEWYQNLCGESKGDGVRMEQMALDKCALAVYTSEWAAGTALEHYRVDADKVRVLNFGGNIESDRIESDVREIVDARPSGKCKMVFNGIEWDRKGGDIAVAIAGELHSSGMDVELTLIGCGPPEGVQLPEYVRPAGFISKSTDEGIREFEKLIAESHFLLLPTRADCTPMVVGEANSFGVPCLLTDVGGIPSIVTDELNGKKFPLDDAVPAYCEYVTELMGDYARYKSMALSAFRDYQTRLNWDASARTMKGWLTEVVG
jgi:glycosyltransferase involved in cell wall biosynthesis